MDEKAINALFVQLVRAGVIDEDIVLDAAEECDAAGEAMSAHRLQCLVVTASGTPETEIAQQRRRANLRAIDGGNGD